MKSTYYWPVCYLLRILLTIAIALSVKTRNNHGIINSTKKGLNGAVALMVTWTIFRNCELLGDLKN